MSTNASEPRPASWRVWYLAARPKTLWAAVAPVLMGSAVAYRDDALHIGAALAAWAGAMLLQVGTNFCNDYADFKKGADTADRIGPIRATQAGWVTPKQMGWASVLAFGLAALVGLYLVHRGGTLMAVVMLLSIAAGILYTVGPYALAYLGLGDVFVLIFFGPVAVGGTYYVQARSWPMALTVAGLAAGLLSCAILAVNNLRDIEQDRAAGKRTLAVRFGSFWARTEYVGTVVLALFAVPLVLWLGFDYPASIGLVTLALVAGWQPLAAVLGGVSGPALNPVLGQTARMLMLYAVLFTIALMPGIF